MPKIYDLAAPGGTYTDPKTGEERTRWHYCGALIEKQNGKRAVKLETIPVDFNGWLECLEPKQPHKNAEETSRRQEGRREKDEFDDSVPF